MICANCRVTFTTIPLNLFGPRTIRTMSTKLLQMVMCSRENILQTPSIFFALSSPLASKGPKDWGASPNQRVSIQKGPPVQGQISTPKTIKSQAENRVSWKCSKARPSRVRPQKCTGQHSFNSALPLVFGHSSVICSDISAQHTHGPKL